MDVSRVCLVLALCMALIGQSVLATPTPADDVDTYQEFVDEDFFDPFYTGLLRKRRDAEESSAASGTPSTLLTRLRRQISQMGSGGRNTYSGGRRHGPRSRPNSRWNAHRRIYNSRNGQVANW